ncbi:MAG: autotransporter-associated beta strand repeat-containing protein [Chthoniobacter sp.]
MPIAPAATTGGFVNSIASLSGLLKINTAGTYFFRSGTDDQSLLYIDGVPLINFATANQESPVASITLDAGFHTITYKAVNQGSGGAYRLVYSGPDTVAFQGANATANNFQAIPSSQLYSTSASPTAANNYNYAAIINNDYALAANGTATIDTFATQFGAVIAPNSTLTLGDHSALNITNGSTGSFGTGWFGAAGGISAGNGVILNTGSTANAAAGVLNLIGAVTHAGAGVATGVGTTNALIKTGTGTLVLGGDNTATFTGALVIQGGTVMLNSPSALPPGRPARRRRPIRPWREPRSPSRAAIPPARLACRSARRFPAPTCPRAPISPASPILRTWWFPKRRARSRVVTTSRWARWCARPASIPPPSRLRPSAPIPSLWPALTPRAASVCRSARKSSAPASRPAPT